MVRRWRDSMDPQGESKAQHSAHVRAWKRWYQLEGRFFDNGRRHPACQIDCAPANAQIVGSERDGYWLPPRPLMSRLYGLFGLVAPDRFIRYSR